METVKTLVRISRKKLMNCEYSSDQINTSKLNEPGDCTSLWQPAGELLIRCFNLGNNS